MQRKDITDLLFATGVLTNKTSPEVARVMVQKALKALGKKLARFNEDHGTSWTVETKLGRGLRLTQHQEAKVANAPSIERRIAALELGEKQSSNAAAIELRLAKIEQRIAKELDASEDTNGVPQIAYLRKTLEEVLEKVFGYVKGQAKMPTPIIPTGHGRRMIDFESPEVSVSSKKK